ncbi:Protein TAR1 [Capsicum annuum]|uniref:Protein TAR1 n=1 Tax=Capsicum annuum TaxID=4072 RepID=A0A2G2XUL3_CAPAN|nr:Protein TAR1 [Capsicum annuum]
MQHRKPTSTKPALRLPRVFGRPPNPRWSTSRVDQGTGPSPFHIRPGRIADPIRFPPGNFKHSLTLFSKSISSFPRGTCSLSVSRPYLALDGIQLPIWAAFPNNPTRRQRLMVRQGSGTTGLSPSLAPPSRGLRPDPPLRTLLQTTTQTTELPDSKAGLFPVRSLLLRESLQTCPRPNGFGRNLRSKTRWFTGFCNSHQVSHFATFFIDARAEISVAESRFFLQTKHRSPRRTPRTGREGQAVDSGFDNDPSAGSPTETLLRLLLPLNDKVQWTSRDVAGSEPPTSPRSEHFTGSFNR